MSSPGDQTDTQAAASSQTVPATRRSRLGTVLWIVVALVVAFFAVAGHLPQHSRLMAFKFLFLWLAGSFLGYIGVRLGDAVRRIVKPDVLVVSGGVSDAIWARICWGIGPQVVGLYLGAVTGTSILAGWIT